MVSRRTNVRRRRRAPVGTRKRKPTTRSSTTYTSSTGRRVRPRRTPRAAANRTRKRVGKRKAPRGSAKAAKDLAVFHNPFSKATQQARIPDGKATASLGTRLQNVVSRHITIDPDLTGGQNIMHVLLYPGLGAGCVIQGTGSTNYPDCRGFYLQGFKGHGLLQQNMNGAPNSWPNDATADGSDVQLKQVNALAKWRLVSQGLSIKLVNNHEENDGWFECVRINQVKDQSDYMVTTINDSTAGTDVTVAPNTAFIETLIADTNLAEEPSYQTGLLKDIHKHMFINHPLTNECKFKELTEEYRLRVNPTSDQLDAGTDVDGNGVPPSGLACRTYDIAEGSARGNKLINGMVDQEHDMVYIRIHGRTPGAIITGQDPPGPGEPNIAAVGAGATQLLFHLVANHEIMYDSSRDISKYMMPGQSVPKMDAQYAAKKSSTAAADVNMGTSALA